MTHRFVEVTNCFYQAIPHYYVCERKKTSHKSFTQLDVKASISISAMQNEGKSYLSHDLIKCSSQHWIKSFLACETDNTCDASKVNICPLGRESGEIEHKGTSRKDNEPKKHTKLSDHVLMFQCQESYYYIHYTHVCDHKPHCPGHSDENFCIFKPCLYPDFHCGSGECISQSRLEDNNIDCNDMSDEVRIENEKRNIFIPSARIPSKITFDGRGSYTVERMNNLSECPSTHFVCPDGLCLPVYVICNGGNDCQGKQFV